MGLTYLPLDTQHFVWGSKAKQKKMFCLEAPASIHFSLRVHLSWNGRFVLLFSSIFFFFLLFCQKLAICLQIRKIKIIATRSIWQQPSLVTTPMPVLRVLSWLPSQFSTPFLAIQTNYSGWQWSQQVVKKKKKTHSASVFETLESFKT